MKFLMAMVFTVSSMNVMASPKAKPVTTTPVISTFKVDPAATKITYVGKKVTGEHTGTLTAKSGTITTTGDLITAGEVLVDMNTLTTTDITDKDLNAKYVGHMKSPDFFNTEKFPESKLNIKSSKKTDKGLEVTADLTMIGETKSITFIVTDIKQTPTSYSGKSNVTLNRTHWGLKYGSNSFIKGLGDKAIYDDFTLAIELSAKK